jgi:plastocyanin
MKRTVQLLTAAGVAALLVLAPVTAGAGASPQAHVAKKKHHKKKPVKKTVRIFDNYYEPAKLTIPRGSTVTWKWPVTTGDSHDVTLDKGPKGVKKFQSDIAASDFSYKRKFKKKGKYHIICTLHEEMTMDIRVR